MCLLIALQCKQRAKLIAREKKNLHNCLIQWLLFDNTYMELSCFIYLSTLYIILPSLYPVLLLSNKGVDPQVANLSEEGLTRLNNVMSPSVLVSKSIKHLII